MKLKLHTQGFHYLPTRSVACTLQTRAEVDEALAGLARAGFSQESIVVLHGETGLRWLDADGMRHGRFAKFARAVQRAGSEGDAAFLDELEAALEDDRFVLIVETDGTIAQRREARGAVEPHSTGTVFYCGRLAIEEL